MANLATAAPATIATIPPMQRATRGYHEMIEEIMRVADAESVRLGRGSLPSWLAPAHVEAWMRLEHGTLDALSRAAFMREALIGIACAQAEGMEDADRFAASYGWKRERVS